LSSSRILTVATDGLPRFAFEALLRVMLKVSVDSFAVSFVIERLRLFDDSPGANVNVPEAAV
jgi:hypothetical protein